MHQLTTPRTEPATRIASVHPLLQYAGVAAGITRLIRIQVDYRTRYTAVRDIGDWSLMLLIL